MGRIFRHRELRPRPSLFKARAWESHDLDVLARAVADLALGQSEHVEELLRSSDAWKATGADYAIDGAIQLLSVPPGQDAWHRDGWVFQLISWIAAIEECDGPTRIPQMEQASKGFDGLQLEADKVSGEVKRVIVFEDKATNSPRRKVREEVWTSFQEVEDGDRDPALAAEVGFLLRSLPNINRAQVIDAIMRHSDARAYRVSVTCGSHHAWGKDFNGLYEGFEHVVPGQRHRRRGNVFEVADLRGWMDRLCSRAIELLEDDRV